MTEDQARQLIIIAYAMLGLVSAIAGKVMML